MDISNCVWTEGFYDDYIEYLSNTFELQPPTVNRHRPDISDIQVCRKDNKVIAIMFKNDSFGRERYLSFAINSEFTFIKYGELHSTSYNAFIKATSMELLKTKVEKFLTSIVL